MTAPRVQEEISAPNSYSALSKGSLRAVSMENGIQYSAIYWETGHRTWLPFWASMTQKFTWKIIDDQIRRFWGFTKSITSEPFVFYSSPRTYMRQYFGDPDVHLTAPLSVKWNFAFCPTGTETFEAYDAQVQQALAANAEQQTHTEENKIRAINAIIRSSQQAESQ
ncbi:uncharacterized protein LOC113147640 [Cyclospora cayetanensis]|uniref:Uncharacterized protein LOC113147640 n=1 Tax=Cyclospora cayetanensis TaxID=88456 RepID=A0A6P6S5G6_9EIME|nr:uncharacterized protein LOC113147640 [Cyclospora cayetanensis]